MYSGVFVDCSADALLLVYSGVFVDCSPDALLECYLCSGVFVDYSTGALLLGNCGVFPMPELLCADQGNRGVFPMPELLCADQLQHDEHPGVIPRHGDVPGHPQLGARTGPAGCSAILCHLCCCHHHHHHHRCHHHRRQYQVHDGACSGAWCSRHRGQQCQWPNAEDLR